MVKLVNFFLKAYKTEKEIAEQGSQSDNSPERENAKVRSGRNFSNCSRNC